MLQRLDPTVPMIQTSSVLGPSLSNWFITQAFSYKFPTPDSDNPNDIISVKLTLMCKIGGVPLLCSIGSKITRMNVYEGLYLGLFCQLCILFCL